MPGNDERAGLSAYADRGVEQDLDRDSGSRSKKVEVRASLHQSIAQ
jgi:hypothetical protein